MANPSAEELKLLGMTLAQFQSLPPAMQAEMIASFNGLGNVDSGSFVVHNPQGGTVEYTAADAKAAAEQQYLNSQADQISSISPHDLTNAPSIAFQKTGVAKAAYGATDAAINAAKAAANAISSPFGWLKNLFSAQLWDRILFVLGGVLLVVVGLVLMLHKSLPTPIPV